MFLRSIFYYFQVLVCFGAEWILRSILELTNEDTSSCPRNQSQSRELEGVSIDAAPLVSFDTILSGRARLGSRLT